MIVDTFRLTATKLFYTKLFYTICLFFFSFSSLPSTPTPAYLLLESGLVFFSPSSSFNPPHPLLLLKCKSLTSILSLINIFTLF